MWFDKLFQYFIFAAAAVMGASAIYILFNIITK